MGTFSFIISSVYTIAGIAAFVVFLMMQFYAAAVFGFCTAAISGVTANIEWLHRKRRLELWYDKNDLWQIFWLGFWVFALSTSGFVYFLTNIIIVQKFQMNLVVAIIWSFISLKSGAFLMYSAEKYGKNETPALIYNEEHSNEPIDATSP